MAPTLPRSITLYAARIQFQLGIMLLVIGQYPRLVCAPHLRLQLVDFFRRQHQIGAVHGLLVAFRHSKSLGRVVYCVCMQQRLLGAALLCQAAFLLHGQQVLPINPLGHIAAHTVVFHKYRPCPLASAQ